jgi:two-component system response regulator YesN
MGGDPSGEGPRLREILDLEELGKLFSHFSAVAGLDAALFDPAGREMLSKRRASSICAGAENGGICRAHVAAGGRIAAGLGEPYIFTCGCGLVMCSSPVMFEERLIGIIVCGPAVLWEVDEVAVSELARKIRDLSLSLDPVQVFKNTPSYECKLMTSAARMFFIMVNSLTREHSRYLREREKISRQQAAIAELILERKVSAAGLRHLEKQSAALAYPVEKEKELVAFVQSGNKQRATALLNDILGLIFSMAGGNLDTIRVKLFELTAFLSRAAFNAGAPLAELNAITKASFEICEDHTGFERLCSLTTQTMEAFIDTVYRNRERKPASLQLTRAIDYIRDHYREELSLGTVAQAVYVSEYYLSHLFRKEMDQTFSDYVTKVRLEKAREFLRDNPAAQIQEAADMAGFADPNYFAKTFKKLAGISPREYQALFR